MGLPHQKRIARSLVRAEAADNQTFWNRLDYKTIDPIDHYMAVDGFCDEEGKINRDLPGSQWNVTFSDGQAKTVVVTSIEYASVESLQAAIDMGLKRQFGVDAGAPR